MPAASRSREDVGQLRELEPVELDVLPRRELAVALAVEVRDLADRAQLRGRERSRRHLDAQHERPDLRLVVVEAPPLEADDVLLRHALVAGGDQRRQLVADPERRLLLLHALDRVALVDQLPGGRGAAIVRGYVPLLHLGKWLYGYVPSTSRSRWTASTLAGRPASSAASTEAMPRAKTAPSGPTSSTPSPARKSPSAPDADGEQARAALATARARAGVDCEPPGDALAVAEPELERRTRASRAANGCRALAAAIAGEPPSPSRPRSPSGCRRPRRAPRRRPCSPSRRARARCPGRSSRSRAAAPSSISTPSRSTPSTDGEQHEQAGADEERDLRGERVVVAEADLVGRGRVVLVHDRHDAELEQRLQGVPHVDVGAALGDLGAREQDLRRVEAVRRRARPATRAGARPARAPKRPEPRQAPRPPVEPEPAQAERDRAGGDDADRRAAVDDRRDLAARARSSERRGRPRSSTTRLEPSLTTSGRFIGLAFRRRRRGIAGDTDRGTSPGLAGREPGRR